MSQGTCPNCGTEKEVKPTNAIATTCPECKKTHGNLTWLEKFEHATCAKLVKDNQYIVDRHTYCMDRINDELMELQDTTLAPFKTRIAELEGYNVEMKSHVDDLALIVKEKNEEIAQLKLNIKGASSAAHRREKY